MRPAWRPTGGAPAVAPDRPLAERYGAEAVGVFTEGERRRFLDARGQPVDPAQLPWELLYRLEPDLYERLIRGERLHPGIIAWLPAHVSTILELGAGTGRLTVELASRCDRLIAVEPAAPLRQRLRARMEALGHTHVDVVNGFFDELPAAPESCRMVISCSAFSPSSLFDPGAVLESIEWRCAPDGLTVLVWPNNVEWLRGRGYQHVAFAGSMQVEYESLDEALSIARVFYPHAVAQIERAGSRFVGYDILGVDPPRDLCWKARA